MKRQIAQVCALVVFVGLGACADADVAKAPMSAPQLADFKSDSAGATLNERGQLAFGDEVFGEFTVDDQLEAYTFEASAGARITLDNTHKGSSRALDSMLFLYGPLDATGKPGAEPIASDDDSGWGRHARIKGFTLPARGTYMAVLGTYAGLDRGRYRLTLTCDEVCEIGALVAVNKEQLATGEAGETDTFTVSLTEAPSDHVVIWVDSTDTNEAVPFPIKLVFCAPGYVVDDKFCAPIEDPSQQADAPEWARQVEVTVHGVRDATADDDTDFEITLTVVTEAPEFAGVTLSPLEGINFNETTPFDYKVVEGVQDDALIEALYALTSGHTAYGYLGQNSIRTVMFSSVDAHDGVVEGLYDGSTVISARESSNAFQLGFNTEHSWPQGQFDGLEPMKSDLHHIFPTDVDDNGLRSSYDFGMTSKTDAMGSLLGQSVSGSNKVYQVRPERRGDVARAHFYMVARYQRAKDEIGIDFDDDTRSANGSINDVEEAVLRQWHIKDPVDDAERTRNDRIEAFQGNRNPFVDRPELVEKIGDF
ncbi:MAG: deoxyribonuclease-1 [Myxococcota bacterium]